MLAEDKRESPRPQPLKLITLKLGGGEAVTYPQSRLRYDACMSSKGIGSS